MKTCAIFLCFCTVGFTQTVRLHGRVYNSNHPDSPVDGVTVIVNFGVKESQKLTGHDGTYAFVGLSRGAAVVKFEKKKWQPDPRTDHVDLEDADVEYDADLFLPPSNDVDARLTVSNKAERVKLAIANMDSKNGQILLANEWQSCQDSTTPVHFKAACAQGLLKISPNGISLPASLDVWAKVAPSQLNALENNIKWSDLTKSTSGIQALMDAGVPRVVIYAHIMYQLDNSTASDADKKYIEALAKTDLDIKSNGPY